ncbi:hypothetical protein D3C81_2295970 [compost metagenome]
MSAGGAVLAANFFSTIEATEAFSFDMNDLVNFMIVDREGYGVLEELLDAVDARVMVG